MQVWYINLDRRRDRREAIESNLKEMGVPDDRIHRFPATDRDAFETPNALVAHAVELGYPEFQIFLKRGRLLYLGYMVSYFRALDAISKQSKTVLLMEDDYALDETYAEICASFDQLPKPVKFAMLAYNINNPNIRTCSPVSKKSVWQYGAPANGNMANIYTPEGAGWLLDICKERLPLTPEHIIHSLPLETPYIYSRKLDHIKMSRPTAKGDTDVMNEKGDIFASKLIPVRRNDERRKKSA